MKLKVGGKEMLGTSAVLRETEGEEKWEVI
jgi:hypothetical protein